jgi:hypothetical protein
VALQLELIPREEDTVGLWSDSGSIQNAKLSFRDPAKLFCHLFLVASEHVLSGGSPNHQEVLLVESL